MGKSRYRPQQNVLKQYPLPSWYYGGRDGRGQGGGGRAGARMMGYYNPNVRKGGEGVTRKHHLDNDKKGKRNKIRISKILNQINLWFITIELAPVYPDASDSLLHLHISD